MAGLTMQRGVTSYGTTQSPFTPEQIVDAMIPYGQIWGVLLQRANNGDRDANTIIDLVLVKHVPLSAFVPLDINQAFSGQR